LSKVFTFTKLPQFYCDAQSEGFITNIIVGGTGFYAGETNKPYFGSPPEIYSDPFLIQIHNKKSSHISVTA
jgi:hypothetical protein